MNIKNSIDTLFKSLKSVFKKIGMWIGCLLITISKFLVLRFVFTFIFAAFLSFLLLYFLRYSSFNTDATQELLEPMADDWYMNAFFNRENQENNNDDKGNHITIYDITDSLRTRGHLKDILLNIAEQKPKVIGVDIDFLYSKNYDTAQRDSLIKAFKKLRDDSIKVVLSAYKEGDSIRHPDILECLHPSGSIKEGITNQDPYNLTDYSPYPYQGDTLCFATIVAELATNRNFRQNESFVINYRQKTFSYHPIESLKNIDSIRGDSLRNRIVLIGSLDDPNDQHFFPFIIEDGGKRLAGLKILAYEINTLIAGSMGYEKLRNYPYRYAGKSASLIRAVYYCVIFFIVLEFLNWVSIKIKQTWLYPFFSPFFLIAYEIFFVIPTCCRFTRECMLFPDVVLSIAGVTAIGFSYELLRDIMLHFKK